MDNIIVAGEKLDESQKFFADKLISEYYKKIKRQLKNEVTLKVNIREHKKQGEKQNPKKAKKFVINVTANAPTKVFEAEADDWDFERTLHKVFTNIQNQIEHRFHSSNQHDE